jgi:hypothetical protein
MAIAFLEAKAQRWHQDIKALKVRTEARGDFNFASKGRQAYRATLGLLNQPPIYMISTRAASSGCGYCGQLTITRFPVWQTIRNINSGTNLIPEPRHSNSSPPNKRSTGYWGSEVIQRWV